MEEQKAEEEMQFKRDESSTGGQIRSEMKQNKVPLWGEYAIEVCAAGVSRLVLYSEHISQNIKSLSTCSIFTHQLGLQKRRPPPLQSLHTTYIRLENRERDQSRSDMIEINDEKQTDVKDWKNILWLKKSELNWNGTTT